MKCSKFQMQGNSDSSTEPQRSDGESVMERERKEKEGEVNERVNHSD